MADLAVSGVNAPLQISDGETITVGFTVANLGSGPTDTEAWTDTVWLTRDKNRPHPGQGDFLLESLAHEGHLERNAGYDVTTEVTIPAGIEPGLWYITPWSDPYNNVTEDTLADNTNPDDPNQVDNNNYKARAIDVLAKLPDLQVTELQTVATAEGADTIGLSYRVENRGNAPAVKGWVDRVYLSDRPNPLERDAVSLLLAEVPHLGNLPFGDGYTRDLSIELSPSAAGQYLVVLTDAGAVVREFTEDNNLRCKCDGHYAEPGRPAGHSGNV